ncbi:MAG: VWA domain-containing protein [Chloroflexi bacterium]|nr:VWA domain-containing protein [Chloroflexota bacterium]
MEDIVPYDDALEDIEFADNPEPRCAVVLLLDTSGSMQGRRIDELNAGLRALDRALKADALAALRVELAVVAFGGEARLLDVRGIAGGGEIDAEAEPAFVTVDGFKPPVMLAAGGTPMGEAMRLGLRLLRERKLAYRRNGIDYFRPWIFLITDGRPTDSGWEAAAEAARQEEAARGVTLFAVGVEGADMAKLARFSAQRPPLMLRGLAFEELFVWLSKSLTAVSQSRPGEQAPLPPVGWGEVDTSAG